MRQRDLFLFWLPLFASWLLMMAEGPLISAVINRLPEAVLHLAAIGIVFSLAVAIESPIINLLATSTALVKDGASYRQVRRFTLHWAAALTVVATLLAFTPLFDLVVLDGLAVPADIARWVRPAMQVMVPWPAAIAWRRFLQGVLISRGRTGAMAWGTALRLVGSGATAIGLALGTDLPAALVGAYGLIAGVVAEALFATRAARGAVAELVRLGFVLLIPLPPLATVVAWLRGILIGEGRTLVVNEAMVVRLGTTGLLLAAGLTLEWRGITVAALALVLSVVAEAAYLGWRHQRGAARRAGEAPRPV